MIRKNEWHCLITNKFYNQQQPFFKSMKKIDRPGLKNFQKMLL